MKSQKKYPDWWTALDIPKPLRERLLAQFTITRDGYARWYQGEKRTVCGKRTDPRQVEDRWADKRKEIDAPAAPDATPVLTYREVLSEFLGVQKARIGAKRRRIEQRTYHNYVTALNDFGAFRFEGRKVADMNVREVGPQIFSAYARAFKHWSASAFDSLVCRVGTLFRWAEGQEYVDRYRPGPEFVRPAKKDVRDERIELEKSYTPSEIAEAYVAGNQTTRCWIALGVCAAFNNSDVGHATRTVVDLSTGIIDFRRRKTGRVRRVIPLPPDVVELLKGYDRPEPTDPADADVFFITRHGHPYTRSRKNDGKPSDSVSRVFAKLLDAADVKDVRGRNFGGLRTTFFNLAPRGEWEMERKIVMGRAQGSVDLDSYLEDVGLERLRHVVSSVWGQVRPEIDRRLAEVSTSRQGATPPGGASRATTGASAPAALTPPPPAERTTPTGSSPALSTVAP